MQTLTRDITNTVESFLKDLGINTVTLVIEQLMTFVAPFPSFHYTTSQLTSKRTRAVAGREEEGSRKKEDEGEKTEEEGRGQKREEGGWKLLVRIRPGWAQRRRREGDAEQGC